MLSQRPFSFSSLLLLTLVLGTAASAHATTVKLVNDKRLVDQAQLVVVARVLGTLPAPALDRPVTDYLVNVERVLKGAVGASSLLVRVPGGLAADGMTLKLWGAPEFVEGERALLFLGRHADGTYRVLHFMLGAFREARISGHAIAFRDFSEVDVMDEAEARGTENRSLRDFDLFADWIADRAALRLRPQSYYVPISGSSQNSLLPMFTLLGEGGRSTRWFQFDSGGAVSWKIDPDPLPGFTGNPADAMRNALAAWNAESHTPIRLTFNGTSGATAGFQNFDNQNVLLFEDPNNDIEGAFSCSSGGTLAIGGPWYDADITGRFKNETFLRIQGGDVVLNDGLECFFARSSNPVKAAEELFAHELGHTLGLGHSSENAGESSATLRDALMFFRIHNDGRGARLANDDLAGIRRLYEKSGGGGGNTGCPAATLCLVGGRFQVTATWSNQFNGMSGAAGVVSNTDVSGFMFFDDGANIELIVKILDFGNVFKVFYGQLTNLRFTMSVLDTATGVTKTYSNTPGECGAIDNTAFPMASRGGLKSAELAAFAGGTCRANGTTLCLQSNRIQVTGSWRNQYDGTSGVAQVTPLSQVTGGLYFLDRTNLEILVKAVDFGTYFLLMYGSLSDFEYHLTISDTVTGVTRTYDNPPGRYCGALDGTTFVK